MNLRFTHLAVIGVLAAAFALAGCGRKGPLDPPPAAEVSDAKPAKPRPGSAGASLNPLQPSEQRAAAPAFDAEGRPLANSRAPKKQLPMDWLLD